MKIKEYLYEQYRSADKNDKALFLAEAHKFLYEICAEQIQAISELSLEKETLSNRINRAAGLIDEAQKEVVKAKKNAISETKRNLQITRDRLVAISSTSSILGALINEAGDKSVMIDTLNNIIASIGIVADEFVELGLWDADENRPDTTPLIVESNKAKKRSTTKKKTESQGNGDQLII